MSRNLVFAASCLSSAAGVGMGTPVLDPSKTYEFEVTLQPLTANAGSLSSLKIGATLLLPTPLYCSPAPAHPSVASTTRSGLSGVVVASGTAQVTVRIYEWV